MAKERWDFWGILSCVGERALPPQVQADANIASEITEKIGLIDIYSTH
jgi:hypothetical protein